MGKLTILALLSVLAIAHVATAFTATVVEENRPEQRCQEQIQRQQQLQQCQTYLREKTLHPESRRGQADRLQRCCEDLKSLDEECRCQGLQQAVRQQQQQQQTPEKYQREQRQRFQEQFLKEAESIPSRCNTSPRRCSFDTHRWI